jgi:hypothetical protein
LNGHVFGHHADDVDPWDALFLDVQAIEGGVGPYASLVSFWRTKARETEHHCAGCDGHDTDLRTTSLVE